VYFPRNSKGASGIAASTRISAMIPQRNDGCALLLGPVFTNQKKRVLPVKQDAFFVKRIAGGINLQR
jgi:hypothetical protein